MRAHTSLDRFPCKAEFSAVFYNRDPPEADIGAGAANWCFVRVSTVEASRSEGSVWISPVFAQTNGRSGEYRRAAENCVQCARAVSALAFAARAKGRFVRTADLYPNRSERVLSAKREVRYHSFVSC